MISLQIVRSKRNLRNGSKNEEIIFYSKNASGRAIYKLFQLLITNKVVVGGDRVIQKRNGIITKDYLICLSCCQKPQQTNKDMCSKCYKEINKSLGFLNAAPLRGLLCDDADIEVAETTTEINTNQNNKFYKFNFDSEVKNNSKRSYPSKERVQEYYSAFER